MSRALPQTYFSDVFLICDEENTGNKYYQIWINEKNAGFKLKQLGRLPSGIQFVTFIDVGALATTSPSYIV